MKALLATAFIVCGTVCHAQTDKKMTLNECLEMAKTDNLALKNAQLAVKQAEDMQRTSFTLEPTSFTLGQDLTGGANPDNSLAVGQTFELPQVYKARRKALKKQTEVERIRESLTHTTVAKEVTAEYYNIMFAREKLRIPQKQDSVIRQFHKAAKQRDNSGEVSKLDHINADRMLAESAIKTIAAKNEYKTAQRRMAQLLNRNIMVVPDGEPWDMIQTEVAAPDMGPTRTASPTPVFAAAGTSAVILANSQMAASESELKNLRNEAMPTVSLEGKYQILLKGLNPYGVERPQFDGGNFLAFAVGVNIPLCFGAQAAKVRAAKRNIEIERNNITMLQKELQTAYYEKYSEWTNTGLMVDYYKSTGLKQADEMERIASDAYRNGEINYVELMQNMQAATEIRLQYVDAVNEYNRQVIEMAYMCK